MSFSMMQSPVMGTLPASVIKSHASTMPSPELSPDNHKKRKACSPIPSDASTSTFDSGLLSQRPWSESQEQEILGPYTYYSSQSGKNMRSRLMDAFNNWLQVPEDDLTVIKNVVEMLHNASLLIDDIQDSSDLRRGQPAAHHVYGIAQTINSANYAYFCALAELNKLQSARAAEVFLDELLNLHRGQGMELLWRDTVSCPTEDEYLVMVSNKTGGLLRLAIRLMQIQSQSTIDYVPLADLIGIIYQIRDDYINLCSDEYSQGKGFCEDLSEGKFSFPIIHTIRNDPSNHLLISILKQRTKDANLQKLAVDFIEKTGSFEYSRQRLEVLSQTAKDMARDVDGGRGRDVGVLKILEILSRLD